MGPLYFNQIAILIKVKLTSVGFANTKYIAISCNCFGDCVKIANFYCNFGMVS